MKYNFPLDKPDKIFLFLLPTLNYSSLSLTHPSLKVQLLRHVENVSIIKCKDSDHRNAQSSTLGSDITVFEIQLQYAFAVWPWASPSTSLCFT